MNTKYKIDTYNFLEHQSRRLSMNPKPLIKMMLEIFNENDYVTESDIREAVCDYFGVHRLDLSGKSRRDKIVIPRYAYSFLCRCYTKFTLKEIGAFLGGRDHTTIVNAISQSKNLIETDVAFKEAIRTISKQLFNNEEKEHE